MNFLFLPDKVKKQLGNVFSKALPLAILRLNRCSDGSNGEGFIIAGAEKVFIFSRKVGESAYSMMETSFDKINNLKISKGNLDSFIEFNAEGKNFSLSFAPFEERYVKPLIEKWQYLASKAEQAHGASTPPPTTKNTVTKAPEVKIDKAPNNISALSPSAIFSAALMFIAASDNKMADSENYFINKKLSSDKLSLEKGTHFYDNHSFAELLSLLPALSHQQKLCILANMIELSMVEDVFGSTQQEMLLSFAKASDIKESEYTSLKDVFIIKNQISVLYETQGIKKS